MKKYGLLGRNIDYSFSRTYFSEKFTNENIAASYVNFDIDSIERFPEIIKSTSNLQGLNVTIPYKQQVIKFLDDLDPHSKAIGAVNTIKIEKNGRLTGYNTDFTGFQNAITPYLKSRHSKALILGTGGASKAIAYALQSLGIDYKFVSRNPAKNNLAYDDLNKALMSEYLLLINCTPLGTFPEVNKYPAVPVKFISSDHLIFDLIYNPEITRLMQYALERGATAINGYKMLVGQAEKSWEIWNSL